MSTDEANNPAGGETEPGPRGLRWDVNGTLSVPVFSRGGDQTGTVEFDAAELGGKINRVLLHEVVLMHLANQRAGTHSTKRRGEVAGSTRKLFRQKGTGNARVGNRRTNKRRGGGTAKGPKPRDYYYRLPKKAIRAAHRMALLSKFEDDEALVIEDFTLEAIKTKAVVEILKALQINEQTVLIATAEPDETVYRSARNLPNVEVLPAAELHTYAVLKQKRLLMTPDALTALREKHKKVTRRPEPAAVGGE